MRFNLYLIRNPRFHTLDVDPCTAELSVAGYRRHFFLYLFLWAMEMSELSKWVEHGSLDCLLWLLEESVWHTVVKGGASLGPTVISYRQGGRVTENVPGRARWTRFHGLYNNKVS